MTYRNLLNILVALGSLTVAAGCLLTPTKTPQIKPYEKQEAAAVQKNLPAPMPMIPPTPSVSAETAKTELQGPINVNVQGAVLLALENNRGLSVERLNTPITQTREDVERAAFDPILSANASAGKARIGKAVTNTTDFGAGLSEFLPTGTSVDATLDSQRTYGTGLGNTHATRAGVSVTQALLRGAGLGPNLVSLRQARLDTRTSEYELRGFAESLVAQVENTYWDYVLALKQVEIVEKSLDLAQRQLEDTKQRVEVGTIAETEVVAAEAEVALRREALIDARGSADTLRVNLVRLIVPASLSGSRVDVIPDLKEPELPPNPLEELQAHIDVALKLRPDLNQAQLLVKRGELELVKTRNGLLPKMDLFINLGSTGYADSFGTSVRRLTNDGNDVSGGVTFEFPVMNRSALAQDRRARITLVQSEEALKNTEDLIREDVETAYIEVKRSWEQVDATAASLRLQEEKLRAEMSKFDVGRSTGLLVAAAQRDYLASQVAEIGAKISAMKALVSFYRLEGSLLERRGISAPGERSQR